MLQRHAADIIKVAAVVTAIPRWVVALLAYDGLVMPASWRPGWTVFSAMSAVGMALVEGIAFAYVFQALKLSKNPRQSAVLVGMATISAVLFVVILTPSIAASVRGQTLGEWVKSDTTVNVLGAVVGASTISIVASVGFAEKTRQWQEPAKLPVNLPQVSVTLPELSAPLPKQRTWKSLLPEERRQVVELSVEEIVARYGVSERTARNWRQHET